MPNLIDLPGQAAAKIQQYAERGLAELHYLRKIIESGAFRLEPPLNYAAMAADIRKWGEIGMLPSFNARRTPNRAAIIDDEGSLTYKELDEAANAVAHGLLAKGVRGGDGVALLARNHRWFAIAEFGCARVGARIILLNSSFSGPQIKEVSEREGAKLIIYDDEYTKDVSKAEPPLGKVRALATTPDGEDSGSTDETLADLIAAHSKSPAPKASKHSSIIILTSGTTGTPKGANRSTPPTLAPIGGILSHVPFKANEVTSLPAPMFHALGFLHATIGMFLGSTLVLHGKFKPDRHRETQGDSGRRGAGDVGANPRRIGKDGPKARSVEPADHFRLGVGAGRRLGRTDAQGHRAGDLQHVRLDGDRLRHHRRTQAPATQFVHGGARRQRCEGQDLRRKRQGAAAG
jgi:fatty-acyl-CoA synthase